MISFKMAHIVYNEYSKRLTFKKVKQQTLWTLTIVLCIASPASIGLSLVLDSSSSPIAKHSDAWSIMWDKQRGNISNWQKNNIPRNNGTRQCTSKTWILTSPKAFQNYSLEF
ncbi:uncharacterized protein LOC110836098 [Zootermopsis nevadensis]|uniref:uncharacterized protein LOC110836098 n=1 Tax=Zootermopsis nevadensis TaxID=136037 RepID=UPI000B8E9D3B|nr:uncharacterized protein LOC110836098 [Zootermopsis nevadensis]